MTFLPYQYSNWSQLVSFCLATHFSESWSPSHFVISSLCEMVLKTHRSSPEKSLLQKLLLDVLMPFCVFGQSFEWVHFFGWEATPHMDVVRMLRCWHDTRLMIHLFLFQTARRGLHQRKLLCTSLLHLSLLHRTWIFLSDDLLNGSFKVLYLQPFSWLHEFLWR